MSRRWLLPLIVLLLWLCVGGPLGSFAGQLASVQENDNAAFLPRTAESTQVLNALGDFQEQETLPVAVVFERTDGLTDEDRAAVEEYAGELAQVANVAESGVSPPQPSEDGAAVQLVVQVATSDGEEIGAAVADLREVITDPPDGLTALVGGQGGVLADFVTAFGAIDGILLLVALVVVFVILVIVYRSPVLPITVLFSAVLALGVASAVIYGLASGDLLDLNGQSQGILFILTIGAATDYALLIVARFREELRDHESPYDAMRAAYRASIEPIAASGLTVILGLLCLLLSDLSSLAGLGPVGAIGVACAMLSALSFLPAVLVLLGRRAFWPFQPAYRSPHRDAEGLWGAVARLIGRRAGAVGAITGVVLLGFAGFIVTLNEDPVPQTELFLTEVESVDAQEVLDARFAVDTSSPAQIVVPTELVPQAVESISSTEGVARSSDPAQPTVFPLPEPDDPGQPRSVDGESIVFATLTDTADSAGATATVERLRETLHEMDGDILVGGATAIQLDVRETTSRDRMVVIPAILLVILLVLMLLLRSIVAPVLLVVANVVSFGATMGISALVFNHVFGFPASDPSTLLIAFVFLVALGIDYSIFLMTRVREESIKRGTRPGILKGLSVTGGVITSAGVVLAATFAALSVVPILFLAQIAFIVAFGVLLDTLVVRSLLVPAIAHRIGPKTWWPGALGRESESDGHPGAHAAR